MIAQAETLGRAVRFATVGLAVAALYTVAFALLVEGGMASYAANVAAYCGAIVVQFFGHRHFTYRAGDALRRSVPRFLLANGLGLGFSTACAMLLRDALGVDALTTGAAVSLALAAMNWFVFQRWVFQR
jgi:putative flippase GtrA